MAPHIRIKKTSRISIGFPLLKAYHTLIRWFAPSEQAVSLQADRRSRMSIHRQRGFHYHLQMTGTRIS
jgi:hypothetical protein